MADLDALILACLAAGMDIRGIISELHDRAGAWISLFDPGGRAPVSVPDSGPNREDTDKLRKELIEGFLTGDKRAATLLRDGEPIIYDADGSGRIHVCGVASQHGEPQNIVSLSLPAEFGTDAALALLRRLCQLCEFFSRSASSEAPAREANYLEAGLARELIFGGGDISRSIFGNLYELRFDGLSGGLEPDYIFAVMRPEPPGDEGRLAALSRALAKLLPQSYRLGDGGSLYAFIYGLSEGRTGGCLDKLRYFCELNALTCGVSHVFRSLNERGGYRKQAEQVLKIALGRGRKGVSAASGLYLELIVSGAVQRMGKKVLQLTEIEFLAAYDESNHTEYLATLDAYLRYGNRLSPAASSMFIDRSTLKYRLQKISDLLGVDFEDTEVSKRLSMGIAVHRTGV